LLPFLAPSRALQPPLMGAAGATDGSPSLRCLLPLRRRLSRARWLTAPGVLSPRPRTQCAVALPIDGVDALWREYVLASCLRD
jgi:hypothetical protein